MCHASSIVTTSGPRNRAPSVRKVSTGPLVKKRCLFGSVPGAARSPLAVQEVSDRERGLVGARHEHHIPAHHVADRTGEQGVMRATEDQGVHLGGQQRGEQPLGEHVDLVGIDVSGLDELHESRTRGTG